MLYLRHRFFMGVAAVVFLLAGVFHALRAFWGWDLVVGNWYVPIWASWVGCLVLLVLAINAIRLNR